MLKNKLVLYFLFALLASFINIIGQHIFLTFNKNLFLAVIVGSGAGLVFKYVLDNNFVFDGKQPINIKTFFIYAFVGACITPIIWIVEVIFLNIFGTVFMRDIGALLGLALAYFLKFDMDNSYVFNF